MKYLRIWKSKGKPGPILGPKMSAESNSSEVVFKAAVYTLKFVACQISGDTSDGHLLYHN